MGHDFTQRWNCESPDGSFEFYVLTGETGTWNYSYPAHAVFLFHVSACVLGAEIIVS